MQAYYLKTFEVVLGISKKPAGKELNEKKTQEVGNNLKTGF